MTCLLPCKHDSDSPTISTRPMLPSIKKKKEKYSVSIKGFLYVLKAAFYFYRYTYFYDLKDGNVETRYWRHVRVTVGSRFKKIWHTN